MSPKDNQVFKEWSLFPATTTKACYFTESNHIELYDVCAEELATAINDPEAANPFGPLPLLFHELRHWFDHTSTLWGRHRLKALFEALDARLSNDPHEFWRVVAYRRCIREDVRDDYFTTEGKIVPSSENVWKATTTMGLAFDADGRLDDTAPIAFGRFEWKDGSPACRVPVSVASLLEVNAVHPQIEGDWQLGNPVDRPISDRKWISQLYTPSLGVYSVVAHLAANRLGLSDIRTTYRYAAALSSIALNLPSSWFQEMRIPPNFANVWGQLNSAALQRCDRSYAYLSLLEQAARPDAKVELETWMEQILEAAGLGSLSDLESASKAERISLSKGLSLSDELLARFSLLERLGDENFGTLGLMPTYERVNENLGQLNICPVLTSDAEWNDLGKSNQLQSEVETWHSFTCDMLTQFTTFTNACR